MGVLLVLAGLGLVALPGLLRGFGRRLAPRDWARLSAVALVGGFGVFELGLLLYAAPTVLAAVDAFGLAAFCRQMLGGVAPGGAAAGWTAGALATLVAGSGALSLMKGRRIHRSTRVEPWLGEHTRLGRHELVVLPRDELVALSVDCHGGQVVVSSGLVGVLRHDELDVVLAHEAAHLDHGHQRYLTLASVVRHGLAFFPLTARSVTALVVALERWADEVAVATTEDGRARLRSSLLRVTASVVGPELAAFSAADTVLERLGALEAPSAGLEVGSLGLLYSPGLALGVASVAGLGFWVSSLQMLTQMTGRCPL
ncbi:MAG: M48 family metalloprotease [Actinomycetota bacterium]|nr:M48 family metalloprotease [Actinomycetota bacterium]